MNYKNFSDLLWAKVWSLRTGVVAFIGLILGVASFLAIPADRSIELRWFLLIVIFLIIAVAVLGSAAFEAYSNQATKKPKVILAREATGVYEGSYGLLVLEPTPIVSFQALVSIYYLEDGIESLAALGKVINVQEDGKIQVIIETVYGCEDALDRVFKRKEKDALANFIVKTSLTENILGDLFDGR